jgi:hypothetical protein
MRPETTIKLKRIIKEEIRSAIKEGVLGDEDAENQFMKNLISKAEGELSRSKTGNQFKVDKLPNYSMLPDLRKDIDYKKRIAVYLPNVGGGISTSALYSKEDVKNWMDKFKETFGESPNFEVSGKEVKVTNPKFIERQDMSKNAMGEFGTQGD